MFFSFTGWKSPGLEPAMPLSVVPVGWPHRQEEGTPEGPCPGSREPNLDRVPRRRGGPPRRAPAPPGGGLEGGGAPRPPRPSNARPPSAAASRAARTSSSSPHGPAPAHNAGRKALGTWVSDIIVFNYSIYLLLFLLPKNSYVSRHFFNLGGFLLP